MNLCCCLRHHCKKNARNHYCRKQNRCNWFSYTIFRICFHFFFSSPISLGTYIAVRQYISQRSPNHNQHFHSSNSVPTYYFYLTLCQKMMNTVISLFIIFPSPIIHFYHTQISIIYIFLYRIYTNYCTQSRKCGDNQLKLHF